MEVHLRAAFGQEGAEAQLHRLGVLGLTRPPQCATHRIDVNLLYRRGHESNYYHTGSAFEGVEDNR